METTPSIQTRKGPDFTGCCPRFDPAPYQDKEFTWSGERFVKDHVLSVFHIPVNMGKHVVRANALISAADAAPKVPLMLWDEKSPWGADIYIHVTKRVAGANMVELSGTYLTKVFEGPFREVPKWMESMRAHVESRGRKLEKLYAAYSTCPACAKAYGENYVVLFARVS